MAFGEGGRRRKKKSWNSGICPAQIILDFWGLSGFPRCRCHQNFPQISQEFWGFSWPWGNWGMWEFGNVDSRFSPGDPPADERQRLRDVRLPIRRVHLQGQTHQLHPGTPIPGAAIPTFPNSPACKPSVPGKVPKIPPKICGKSPIPRQNPKEFLGYCLSLTSRNIPLHSSSIPRSRCSQIPSGPKLPGPGKPKIPQNPSKI